ncbi:NAD(P)H-dependent glycerol-3-phosphate dehydrogenase [Clostridium sp.]|uniref:NAD(P)H-dependent glycerol-3-phosphate dehydrogenase n=1 Tax=Clostridium sp. TaxID=1506 RepID=UPI0025BC8DD2|nr:NAD(P)H-dependent glycerol-3-phosphate dehydrogenase [Clostridium sp.]MCI9303208.1 NAD(P)H-dependent glycerol-3-phosphate dehydrogenase [Clostridium sp.]
MKKVAFIGGGSFGTALAILLSKKGIQSNVFDIDKDVVDDININRKNDRYIRGLYINEEVRAFTDLNEAIDNVDYLVLSVPSHVVRNICKELNDKLNSNTIIINIAKGIENETYLRLSEVIEEELENPVVILSGPSHAEEVAFDIPTSVVVASKNIKAAEEIQELFMSENFRVYKSQDVIGIEIGGAIKNVIALAAGICDGIGYGDNTKAALISRGMTEIVRIGTKLGGNLQTFFGLTGIGDLVVTCASRHSRNRKAGYLIGKGVNIDDVIDEVGMVVEGIKATKVFFDLKENLNIEMPIIDAIYKVVFENLEIDSAVKMLLTRDKKDEVFI